MSMSKDNTEVVERLDRIIEDLDKDRDVSWKEVFWIVGPCCVAMIMTLVFIFNKTDIKDLRTESKDLRTEMNTKFDKIDDNFDKLDNKLDQILQNQKK